jgi:hypothetical protein
MRRFAFVLFLAAMASGLCGQTTAVLRHLDANGGTLRGIAGDTDKGFVAVGVNGRVLTSREGTSWTARTSGFAENFTSVTSGSGVFVATTDRGRILVSNDGVVWSSAFLASAPLNHVAFGNGFVAVGERGTIVRSMDGKEWTTETAPTVVSLRVVVPILETDRFTVVGAAGAWLENSVGGIWQAHGSGTSADFTAAAADFVSFFYTSSSTQYTYSTLALTNDRGCGLGQRGANGFINIWGSAPVSRPNGRPIRCLVSGEIARGATATSVFPSSAGTVTYVPEILAIDDAGAIYLGLGAPRNERNDFLERHWLLQPSIPQSMHAGRWFSNRSAWFLVGENESVYELPLANHYEMSLSVEPFFITQKVYSGESASFRAFVSGTLPFAYQWEKDGALIPGATQGALTIDSTRVSDSGFYSVEVTSGGGRKVISGRATLTVETLTVERFLINQTVISGESASLSILVSGKLPITYQWTKDGRAILGATRSTLTIDSARASDSGLYAVEVSSGVGRKGVIAGTATLTVRPNFGRLVNLSARISTAPGNGTAIVGFVVGGDEDNTSRVSLLARASGPALEQFGVTSFLPDPILNLFQEAVGPIASNNNWTDDGALAGLAFRFAPGSKDAALGQLLLKGSFTAQVVDSTNTAGITLLEIYDTNPNFSLTRPRLINLSARGNVGTGDGMMIAGFVIQGETPLTVLIRGVGPTLAQFGVANVLANPRLEVFQGATRILQNDNWGDASVPEIANTTAAVSGFSLPANSLDAALVATLQPGAYTVQVSGVGNLAGIALLEIYEVPANGVSGR